jgi:hypothetical protein
MNDNAVLLVNRVTAIASKLCSYRTVIYQAFLVLGRKIASTPSNGRNEHR